MNPIERRRAEQLAELAVLDAPADELIDRVVALAALLTDRDMAAVSLSDTQRQFLWSQVGLGTREVPAELAFCRFAIERPSDTFEIADTTKDPRSAANPLVTSAPSIRAYAGVPLAIDDDMALGTLCVMSTVAGALTERQRELLQTLADVVSHSLRGRKLTRDLADSLADRDEALARRQSATAELHAVFDGVPEGLLLTDADGVVQRVNSSLLTLLGGDEPSRFVGRPWTALLAEGDHSGEDTMLHELHRVRRSAVTREVVLGRLDGSRVTVLASSSAARHPDGTISSVVTRVEDIESRRQAEIELREAQSALDGIITVDGGERIVSWNEGAARLLGHDRSVAIGKHLSLIVPQYAHDAHAAGFARLHNGGEPRLLGKTIELEALTAAGETLPVELSLSRWYRGDEPFYTAVIRDISERRRFEADREWRGSHDTATGLLNMAALGKRFDVQTRTLADGRLRAVFCFQLTNLSRVSAALGASVSRDLAKILGRAFTDANRDDLVVCHLRDTHFGGAVLLEPGAHEASLEERLEAVARYVVDAGSGPHVVDDLRVEMHVKLGIVATRVGRLSFLELLREAEAVRDSSPRQINVGAEVHAAGSPTTMRDMQVLSDFHDAVPRGQLELHYQPVTRLQSRHDSRGIGMPVDAGPQHSVEALVRWRHPARGLVPPADFIPLLETSRMIHDLTDWVVRAALTQHISWRRRGLDVRVSVNVSPQVLLNDDVVALVASALHDNGAAPDRLKIEITESAIVDDPARARQIVASLRRLGVHVSIDDFGTGYTSLRLLRDLAADEIKLDRLFVANATSHPADAAIANAVGQLGQRLGILTVAEGIEDIQTRSLFLVFGYDYMQGYLDARPQPAEQTEAWLREHDDRARTRFSADGVTAKSVHTPLAS